MGLIATLRHEIAVKRAQARIDMGRVRRWRARLAALLRRRRRSRFTMYDAVDLDTIPAHVPAVAGYVNGRWPTYDDTVKRWPRAHHLSITVSALGRARCLDVEQGDATPAQAPSWVRRERGNGVKHPIIYANLSTMPAVLAALRSARIPRRHVRLFVADWTGSPHIPAGYDACQWQGGVSGSTPDISLCEPWFLT